METYDFMRNLGERVNKVNALYYKWAKLNGMTYNRLAVLYVAYKNDLCSQKHICLEWTLPKQTVNTTCKELQQESYILQIKNENNKREICISLTEKGRKFAKPIVEKLLAIESKVIGHIGSENAKEFLRLFNLFCDDMEKEFANSFKEDKNENKG